MKLLLLLLVLYGVRGQLTFTVDDIANVTMVSNGVVYKTLMPLYMVAAGDGVFRCGANMSVRFHESMSGAMFTVYPPPFEFYFVDENGVSTTLAVLWCGPGTTAATHNAGTVMSGATPETHARIVAGTCPPSMLNDGDFYGVDAIAVGSRHACGKTVGGSVYCWGTNDRCQFGTGTVTGTPTTRAVKYPWFSDFLIVYANFDVTCGVRRNGDVVCWGMLAGMPPPGQSCSVYGYARFGFGRVVNGATNASLSVGITRNGVAVVAGNRLYMVELSGSVPTSDGATWTVYGDYNVITQSGGLYWSQYPIWTMDLARARLGNAVIGHGDVAFALWDPVETSVGWLGSDIPCLGLYERMPGLCLVAGPQMTLPQSSGVCSVWQPGGFVMFAPCLYATNMRIFGPVNQTSFGFYYNTAYGEMMGVGKYYDATTGLMTDGLARGGFACSQQYGVCVIANALPIYFSRGTTHYCVMQSVGVWICSGANLYGEIYNATEGLSKTATVYAWIVAAGDGTTCMIVSWWGRVRCVGAYGDGVVGFVGNDMYDGYVDGSVAPGLPAWQQVDLAGTTVQTVMTGVGGIALQVRGRGGCYVEYGVTCPDGTTQRFSAASGPRRYGMTCGNVSLCVEMQTCVTDDWAVHGNPVTSGVVIDVSAGDTFTCRLLLSGVVECVGESTTCGYILPSGGAYDMLEFNAVYTGNIGAIGQIASVLTTSCFIAQDGGAIACSGFTTSYRWCSQQSMFVTQASRGMIIEDMWLAVSAVCYSEAVVPVTATSPRRVWCMGANTQNNLFGYFRMANTQVPELPGRVALRLIQNATYAPMQFVGRVRVVLSIPTSTGGSMIISDARCQPTVLGLPTTVNLTWIGCGVDNFATSAADMTLGLVGRYGASQFGTFGGQWYDGQVVQARSSYANVSCVVFSDGYAGCVGAWEQPSVYRWDRMAGVWGSRYGYIWKLGDGTVTRVAVGTRHVVLLTRSNAMYCIGDNSAGQCGHLYTNVSSDGAIVSMDLLTWPYATTVAADDPVNSPTSVYDASLSGVAVSLIGFISFLFVGLVVGLAFTLSYCMHRRPHEKI